MVICNLSNPIYVQDDDERVYKISDYGILSDHIIIKWRLELVAKVDYVDPKISTVRGYVLDSNPERRVRSLDQNIINESLVECLSKHGYSQLKVMPYMLKGILGIE